MGGVLENGRFLVRVPIAGLGITGNNLYRWNKNVIDFSVVRTL